MKKKIESKISIPAGVDCKYENEILTCKKGVVELSRKIDINLINISIKDNEIIIDSQKANKNNLRIAGSIIAHINNIFIGLEKEFVYKLEACNVHFPMILKLEGDKLIINNFLGEKVPRYAKILPGVKVEIKGQSITLSSHDLELAGQTAGNLEKATKIRNRDRRIFQDGIYITSKPGWDS